MTTVASGSVAAEPAGIDTTSAQTQPIKEHGQRRRGTIAETLAYFRVQVAALLRGWATAITSPNPARQAAPGTIVKPGSMDKATTQTGTGTTAAASGVAHEREHPGLMTQLANAAHSTLDHLKQETAAVSSSAKDEVHHAMEGAKGQAHSTDTKTIERVKQ